ncbi:recombinase family protein [Paenibacillus alvei]|uniref:recombinase family protein n=1 Tax=Paenibacillus alvei TaxID=44250 RepID=UPI0013DA8F99|nr:recombinase family protein [Paenibacillus alvei]NEZ43489.1 hypothetical protein [Paenibacillus alvei]
MRAGLYERVSTEEQAKEGYSIAGQDEKGKAFIISQGWTLHDVYVDEGESAKNIDRPDLQRLMSDVQAGHIDVLVVHRLDRLTRSVKDLYDLLESLEKHGVKFRSVTEPYDTTTAAGKLFITLVAALAQWERENLAERVRFGMEQMFREGKRPGAKMPFGYTANGELVDSEYWTLRKLRELYMGGDGYKTVANTLNELKLLRRGKQWTSFTVYFVLDNPFYAGKMRWGEKKKNGKYASRKMEKFVDVILQDHDYPIVFTWDEYLEQKDRMKRREYDGYSKNRIYWFSGLLKCGKCGCSMTGRYHQNKRKDGTYNKIHSYICTKRQMSGSSACSMPMFRQELVEKLLLEQIENIALDESNMERKMNMDETQRTVLEAELCRLDDELEKILERRKKWQYAFANDLITSDELKERSKEDHDLMQSLKNEVERVNNKLSKNTNKSLKKLLTLPEIWSELSDSEKNEMLRIIFKEIVLHTPLDKAKGTKGKFIPASISEITFN